MRVWIVLVNTENKQVVNRVFTNEKDAERYAKDYSDNTLLSTDLISRELNNKYIDWDRHF